MFRKMRRFKQMLTAEDCKKILREQQRGVLSVQGEDGYPYGVPIDFYYNEENGKIYFHGAKSGHKIDAIKACDKVSFCTWDEGWKKPGEWALNISSVIVFGRIRIVEDRQQLLDACRGLCRKFPGGDAYFEQEIKKAGAAVQVLELTIEHMTGKLVNES